MDLKKSTAALGLSLLFVTAVAFAVGANETSSFKVGAAVVNCEHSGNHYTRLENTTDTAGTEEHWICCSCHEHYLVKPSNGTWSEAGVARNVSSDDDRYIPAINDAAFADYLTELGFGTVTQKEDGTYTVGKFSDKTATNVVIPEGVSSIAMSTFRNRTSVKYVVIPTTLTSIYSNSFSGCNVDLYFVGDTARTADSLSGVNNLYKIQGTGWDYVDGIPTAK